MLMSLCACTWVVAGFMSVSVCVGEWRYLEALNHSNQAFRLHIIKKKHLWRTFLLSKWFLMHLCVCIPCGSANHTLTVHAVCALSTQIGSASLSRHSEFMASAPQFWLWFAQSVCGMKRSWTHSPSEPVFLGAFQVNCAAVRWYWGNNPGADRKQPHAAWICRFQGHVSGIRCLWLRGLNDFMANWAQHDAHFRLCFLFSTTTKNEKWWKGCSVSWSFKWTGISCVLTSVPLALGGWQAINTMSCKQAIYKRCTSVFKSSWA